MGEAVGKDVGNAVGDAVGYLVGEAVGALVGDWVAPALQWWNDYENTENDETSNRHQTDIQKILVP